MQKKHDFEQNLDCNNSHLAVTVSNLHQAFHKHSQVLIEEQLLRLHSLPHTSSDPDPDPDPELLVEHLCLLQEEAGCL